MLCLIIFSITSLEIIKNAMCVIIHMMTISFFLKLFHLFFTSIPYAFTNKRNSYRNHTPAFLISNLSHLFTYK